MKIRILLISLDHESSNNYHPNEISASLFEIIIENEINNVEIPNFPAIKKMKGVIEKFKMFL